MNASDAVVVKDDDWKIPQSNFFEREHEAIEAHLFLSLVKYYEENVMNAFDDSLNLRHERVLYCPG